LINKWKGIFNQLSMMPIFESRNNIQIRNTVDEEFAVAFEAFVKQHFNVKSRPISLFTVEPPLDFHCKTPKNLLKWSSSSNWWD
jgi:hypothetical protein